MFFIYSSIPNIDPRKSIPMHTRSGLSKILRAKLIISIARSVLLRPATQGVPIFTKYSLAMTRVSTTSGVEERIISAAHDVLTDAIEAVEIVFYVPVSLAFALPEDHEVAAEEFLPDDCEFVCLREI